MDLQSTLLTALDQYGWIAIFVSVLISSAGLPLPTSFLLLVVGGFVASGDLDLATVLIAAIVGAVIGDHLGYGLGRWGGKSVLHRIAGVFKAQSVVPKAESAVQRWGGFSVFLSRWLITALGPYINLISGITSYRLVRFSLWDVLGEILWVVAYIGIGYLFSDRLSEISDTLGDLSYVLIALVVLAFLIYKLVQTFKKKTA